MLKKIKSLIYVIMFCSFAIFTISFYFSEANIVKTNKSRSFFTNKLNVVIQNLPLLKNDTNQAIVFRSDIEVYKGKKKNYKFWDLINK